MASQLKLHAIILLIVFLSLSLFLATVSGREQTSDSPDKCSNSGESCRDKAKSLKLQVVAMPTILAAGAGGVTLPLVAGSVPALRPGTSLFFVVKAFASGVILATGFMHVLPDAVECLTSECLPETPWRKFPFATFVAMVSAIATLMVDSLWMSYYRRKFPAPLANCDHNGNGNSNGNGSNSNQYDHEKVQESGFNEKGNGSELIRHRVVAQVLEIGIIAHSVVIGLSLGASDNPCTIRPLIAALCFHQLFEGMGLGGCILLAEYGTKVKAIMVFFFSFTTPLGIALGIGISNIYSDNSPTALVVVGLLNACSAGLLNYMALVELLASDFLGPKLQTNVKLQLWSFASVLLGAGGMSLMAMWA